MNISQVIKKILKKIAGKRLGIIGLGAIGVRVANAAKHLGMEVWGYDPYLSIDAAWNLSRDVKHINDVNDIYAKCDIITIHIPATKDTKGLINQEAISKMKKGVILINLSRDALVNEKDLLKGISSKKIKKYVTDFPTPGIAGQENCIVIPHLGASTEESEDNCAVMAVMETKNYIENGNIINSVNYPNCDMGVCVKPRIAILHDNKPGMLGKFTKQIGDMKQNISDLSNASRGDVAYTLIDLENPIQDKLVDSLSKIKGVIRVRVVNKGK